MTAPGDQLGTLSYLAPEALTEPGTRSDPALDVYAIGAVLYEILSVAPPYQAQIADEPTAASVVERLVRERPEPLTRVAPNAPAELVSIADTAMAVQSADRYASMEAFAADLGAFLEGRVVSAHASGARAKFSKWMRHDRCQLSDELARTKPVLYCCTARCRYHARSVPPLHIKP